MSKMVMEYNTPKTHQILYFSRKWWQFWKDPLRADIIYFPGEIKTATCVLNGTEENSFIDEEGNQINDFYQMRSIYEEDPA
jgi:hypothetical protein